MTFTPNDPLPARPHRLRSGTAARLAGLPSTTLRIWKRRYGVGPGAKTENGQRICSAHCRTAGVARAMFESAMQRVVADESPTLVTPPVTPPVFGHKPG